MSDRLERHALLAVFVPGASAREPVFAVLRIRPGLGLLELVRATGFSPMTVAAAVRSLEAEGVVEVRVFGKMKRHYLGRNSIGTSVPPHLRKLHQLLLDRGALTPEDAIRHFPRSAEATTRHRLGQLERHRLAFVVRHARRLTYRPIDSSISGMPYGRPRT